MALTRIKTGGLTDNSVTDAKVADAITVTGAQTGITQVGTLTAGTWNGTAIASAYLDADTAHLSGSAFTGTISSSTSSTTDSALTLTDAGVADYKFTFPDTSTIRLSTSTSSTKVFDLSNAGSGKMKLSVDGGLRPITGSDYSLVLESTNELNFYNADGYADSNRATLHINYSGTGSTVDLSNSELVVVKGTGSTFAGTVTVGASNGSEEVKANRTRVRHIDGLADASDYSHGDLYVNHISTGNIFLQRDIDHTTDDYMKFKVGGTDRFWIGGASNNWAVNVTGASPYGMQITTTSDGSSSHDAFVIKRAGNAKVFEIFNNGVLNTYGGGTATFAGNLNVGVQNEAGDKVITINGQVWDEPEINFYPYSNFKFKLYSYSNGTTNKKFKLENNGNETIFETGGNNSKDMWFGGDVSAASFTDRTPYPETLKIAYDVLASHKKLDDYDKNDKEHQLDHTKLHDFAKPQITVSAGMPDNEKITKELGQDGRDASAVISCLVEVVNDLTSKVTALENA